MTCIADVDARRWIYQLEDEGTSLEKTLREWFDAWRCLYPDPFLFIDVYKFAIR